MNRELIFKLSDALLDEKVTVDSADWELLLGQIITNRVVGIAYKNLKKSDVKMTNEIEQCLKSTLDYNVRKTNAYIEKVKYIGKIMTEGSFNYALLKGAYLATKVYEIGNRTSNDIDIFLHSSDLTECQELLKNNGFIQGNVVNGKIIPATRREILLSRMNNGDTVPFFKMINESLLEVDLNFSLDFKPRGESDIMKKMLSDVEYVELDDIGFKTLKMTDFIIHLCAHLYKEATTYDWVVRRRDLNLYKFSDINVLLRANLDEKLCKELIERIEEFDMKNECYYTFYNAGLIYPKLYENQSFEQLLSRIKPESLKYMKQIVWPVKKEIYEYQYEFKEWFLVEDRVKELKLVTAE